MSKTYMIWWHSRFVDEFNRDAPPIKDILDLAQKTIKNLEQLKKLEREGKIKVKQTGSINPFYIELLDDSVENILIKNPLIEVVN